MLCFASLTFSRAGKKLFAKTRRHKCILRASYSDSDKNTQALPIRHTLIVMKYEANRLGGCRREFNFLNCVRVPSPALTFPRIVILCFQYNSFRVHIISKHAELEPLALLGKNKKLFPELEPFHNFQKG